MWWYDDTIVASQITLASRLNFSDAFGYMIMHDYIAAYVLHLSCNAMFLDVTMEVFQEWASGEWIREQPPQRVQDKGGGGRSLLEVLIVIGRLLHASTGRVPESPPKIPGPGEGSSAKNLIIVILVI
jgi:hypothetical protein